MTKDEIMELNIEQLEERRAAIVSEIETADTEALEMLSEELDAIEERKGILKQEADEKRAEMLEVLKGDGEVIEEKEERKMDNNIEIRNTAEYLDAWVEEVKGRATAEQRALLTTNATNGTIAVPTYVEEGIKTAWERNEFFRRIRKTYFPGNLKIGYEVSATGAVAHVEGSGEVTEENLVLGTVELKPVSIKKWVSFSDEALDMRGEVFVDYIVDELTDKIIKGVIQQALVAINASSLVATYTGGQAVLTFADIIAAKGVLSGEASDLVLITTRAMESQLKLSALEASFAIDPTDGLPIVYVDSFPGGDSAPVAVIADMSAIHANLPQGDDVKIKVDETTLMTSDLVRVLGRLYVGVGVTAPGRVVKIVPTH